MKAKKLELKFLKKEEVGKNIFTFYFDTEGKKYSFKPGQYNKVFLDISHPDSRGSSRYFTISSSPTDKAFITLTTKIFRTSFKLTLSQLKPGEIVRFFGPLGYFDFDERNKMPKVFLSGGMGVTPYHSTLRYLDAKKIKLPITLISSFPTKKDTIFYEEMKAFEKTNENLKCIYTLTQEQKSYPGFERGRIDKDMIKKYVQDYKKSKFFVVGPEKFELAIKELLKEIGVLDKNVFSENFPGY